MAREGNWGFLTPHEKDLGLRRIANEAGLSIGVLPNGALFAVEHEQAGRRIMLNQLLGSPLHGGLGRLVLRLGGPAPRNLEIMGPAANIELGLGADRILWKGESFGIRHTTTLWLHPRDPVWLWHVELASERTLPCDLILVQDIGLGERGFLMGAQTYASQYVDHHVELHPGMGPVPMCRQNLDQGGLHPWLMQGCLEGAASYATDALQLFGPAFRDASGVSLAFGTDLPGERLQHEVACVAIQSRQTALAPGRTASFTYFAVYDPDHADVSSSSDLGRLELIRQARADFQPAAVTHATPPRGLFQDAAPVVARSLSDDEVARLFPERRHEEHREGRLLSFFVPDGPHHRHVVLRDKEILVARRHGTLLRSGAAMLPDNRTLCATAWMHGVFGAQLTIGNTSLHKLFSVSTEPYNIARASGLRILVELDGAWRLLATPSAFEMGLSDARWLYHLEGRVVKVQAIACGEHPAMQWRVEVEGTSCRFLVAAHLVLGERELDHAGRVVIDHEGKRISFQPDPASLWGERCPNAVYHLVTSSPQAFEAIGGDDLLYEDGKPQGGAHVALRTRAVTEFSFAVTGSMTDAAEADRLARIQEGGPTQEAMLAPARRFWSCLSRDPKLRSNGSAEARAQLSAVETLLPWLAHNAMMHLSVPHGLEQYTGAAWGTRDVCQGPVELLLSLEHDAPVKEILRILLAQQYEQRGDFPQWFMLEPYSSVQDQHAHGDVIVWPLKALCDYVEATNDLAFLDEEIAWRDERNLAKTEHRDSILAHVEKLIATVKARFIRGTHLIRYGEGDWNDSLQPVDPALRDKMVSSWTVALLFEQLNRYALLLRRAGRTPEAAELEALTRLMAADFDRHLVRDGVVAGYAIFEPGEDRPELLLHPSDQRTGLRYSLLPMNRAIIAGLFTPEQARHHLALIREHLLFPDGARLMDKPMQYRGGKETVFRRAETASFFGREIGLMYVHEHLRYGEAIAALGEAEALWEALALADPISVTERLVQATPRQRNAYFSSSDAAFRDRYAASASFARVRNGTVPVDGGWRIYSSGPGLFTRLLLQIALGLRRHFGERRIVPVLPASFGEVTLELTLGGDRRRWKLLGSRGRRDDGA